VCLAKPVVRAACIETALSRYNRERRLTSDAKASPARNKVWATLLPDAHILLHKLNDFTFQLLHRPTMSVTLRTTHGDLKVELFQACPKTMYNFLALCASGAYDGSPFHRSIPGFMVQGGSPSAGSVKDSTSVYGGMFEDEIKSSLRHHARGMLSMANKGPGTNGSQFFFTFAAAPHLDGKNTVFGRLLEGWDVLDKMEEVPVDKKNRPQEAIKIQGVKIHANPLADER
jgi:peptidyl-prolyl cis-trans isomerase-like 3